MLISRKAYEISAVSDPSTKVKVVVLYNFKAEGHVERLSCDALGVCHTNIDYTVLNIR